MWYLKKIPKIAHIYWGNKNLPYLRYLTIYSFHKYNPDWEIRFYYPKHLSKINTWQSKEQKYDFIGKDYYKELKKLPIKFIEFDMITLNINNDISEVFKSDYLRWYLLSTIGGLWTDADIIYFKSMDELVNNKEQNKDIDTLISVYQAEDKRVGKGFKYHHSIGFMLASVNNLYYKKIWESSLKNFNPNNYQSIGILLSHKFGVTINEIKTNFKNKINLQNIPTEVVYPYHARILGLIYCSRDISRFTDNSIGLHWYAGHPIAKDYVNTITEKNFLTLRNVLGITIKKALNG